jgi:hypothetical protein
MYQSQDEANWQQAEVRLREALTDFSRAAQSTYQGRLFAWDALQSLRLIDHCREVFDVVIMNPPFGESSNGAKEYINKEFPESKDDIYAVFIERCLKITRPGGLIGAITNKTGFFLQTFERWRSLITTRPRNLETAVDLGFGVLDAAMVETMMYTISLNECSREALTDFIRLTHESSKAEALRKTIKSLSAGANLLASYWRRRCSDFKEIPGNPICYWVSDSFARLFRDLSPFHPKHGHIYQGIATGDNFRFLRCRWEVPFSELASGNWNTYVKGGASKLWLSDLPLVVRWKDGGAEIKANAQQCYGSASRTIKNENIFHRPGVTYTQVTVKGLSARILPAGCVFDMKGPSVQFNHQDIATGLAIFASRPFRALAKLVTDCRQWHPTSLMKLPYPELDEITSAEIASNSAKILMLTRKEIEKNETSPFFSPATPEATQTTAIQIADLEHKIDQLVSSAYGIELGEFIVLDDLLGQNITLDKGDDDEEDSPQHSSPFHDVVSFAVGVAFGRFDWRMPTGDRIAPTWSDPFAPLPIRSPGTLPDGLAPFHVNPGILVDDPGHPHDLAHLVDEILNFLSATAHEDVRRWLQREFFPFHLQRYSKSRRKAPIYWPIATMSGSYTIWLYYPALSSQTIYTAINDFIEPKLKQLAEEVSSLSTKGNLRNREEEKRLENLQSLELELVELRDTLLKLAPTYKPNHDDGVQITAAPLWPLFRHKPWQKLLKDTWSKLEKGEYDWAHLAMAYWPERVREKCKADKSLAIAHGLEHLYVEPERQAKKPRGRKKAEDDA